MCWIHREERGCVAALEPVQCSAKAKKSEGWKAPPGITCEKVKKARDGDAQRVHARVIAQAAMPAAEARMAKITNAQTHRYAHFTSTLRICAIMFCRSDSVFSGIQATVSEDSGARSGDMRIIAPMIQKGGNTKTKYGEYHACWAKEKKRTYRIQI